MIYLRRDPKKRYNRKISYWGSMDEWKKFVCDLFLFRVPIKMSFSLSDGYPFFLWLEIAFLPINVPHVQCLSIVDLEYKVIYSHYDFSFFFVIRHISLDMGQIWTIYTHTNDFIHEKSILTSFFSMLTQGLWMILYESTVMSFMLIVSYRKNAIPAIQGNLQ